jgi:hypothetical protein
MALKQQIGGTISIIKLVLQYTIGTLFIINGIGLTVYSIASGILMMFAGLSIFPRVQQAFETQTGIKLTPLLVTGLIGTLFIASSILLFGAVNISNAPDVLVPFSQ